MIFGRNQHVRLAASGCYVWILVVEDEMKEPKDCSFHNHWMPIVCVLFIIFRLDINLLFLPPGTIHTFSGSHPPQPTYLTLSYSLVLSLKLSLGETFSPL